MAWGQEPARSCPSSCKMKHFVLRREHLGTPLEKGYLGNWFLVIHLAMLTHQRSEDSVAIIQGLVVAQAGGRLWYLPRGGFMGMQNARVKGPGSFQTVCPWEGSVGNCECEAEGTLPVIWRSQECRLPEKNYKEGAEPTQKRKHGSYSHQQHSLDRTTQELTFCPRLPQMLDMGLQHLMSAMLDFGVALVPLLFILFFVAFEMEIFIFCPGMLETFNFLFVYTRAYS